MEKIDEITVQEAAEAKIKEDNTKKIKRFASHDLAFFYFLNTILFKQFFNKTKKDNAPYYKQRQLLKDIATETLKRLLPNKSSFTIEEYNDIMTWTFIDFHVRMIISKESYLSKSQRQFILDMFEWVDHFVAKGDEEITMTIDNLVDYREFAEEFLKIKEDVESNNKNITES